MITKHVFDGLNDVMKNIKAVIFDLDGTLADSMWVWSKIDEEFFREKNIKMPETLNRDIEGMGFTETAEYFVKTFDLKETVQEIKQRWNDLAMEIYKDRVPLKSGAMEFIKKLSGAGIKTGIATSNSNELLDVFLDSKGLKPYIDAVTTCCDVKKSKPHPDVFITTAAKLGVPPENCLVFEDIPAGITAGKRAGMTVCAVADEYSAHLEDEKRAKADYYIEDFTDDLLREI